MKRLKNLNIDNGDSYQESITLADLDDKKRCHAMVMSWGELSSISLNKTQTKRIINWLNKWLKHLEAQKE